MTNELHPGEVLTAETVGLAVGDLVAHDRCTACIVRVIEKGVGLHVGWHFTDGTQLFDVFENFRWIGRPNAEGWIDAPEGGWKTNPAGDARIVLRYAFGSESAPTGVIASEVLATWWPRVAAFRLSASDEGRGSAHPQEAASVPGEGGEWQLRRTLADMLHAAIDLKTAFVRDGAYNGAKGAAIKSLVAAAHGARKALATNPAREDGPAGKGLPEKVERLRAALEKICTLEPEPFDGGLDMDAIKACGECQRYAGHPVQQGICNIHRQPIWARERHESHAEKAMGWKARSMARQALAALGEGE